MERITVAARQEEVSFGLRQFGRGIVVCPRGIEDPTRWYPPLAIQLGVTTVIWSTAFEHVARIQWQKLLAASRIDAIQQGLRERELVGFPGKSHPLRGPERQQSQWGVLGCAEIVWAIERPHLLDQAAKRFHSFAWIVHYGLYCLYEIGIFVLDIVCAVTSLLNSAQHFFEAKELHSPDSSFLLLRAAKLIRARFGWQRRAIGVRVIDDRRSEFVLSAR